MATAIKILTTKETLIPITKTTSTKVTTMTEREGTPIKATPTNKATMTSHMVLTNKERTGTTTKRELNLKTYFAEYILLTIAQWLLQCRCQQPEPPGWWVLRGRP